MWSYNYAHPHEEELYHYGRKGMKWGQHIFGKAKSYVVKRKKSKQLEKARDAKAKKQKEAAERKKLVESGRLSVKKMTDDEIRTKMERMQLEKDYKKLLSETSKAQKGKDFVGKVMERSGENIATQFTTYAMGAAVNKVAKDVFGVKNASRTKKDKDGNDIIEEYFEDIVNPRKGQKDK